MSIVVTEPKSLALEILDLETDIFATTDKNATIEVPHAELFTVRTDEGAIQLTQTEHYWQSPFATRPSLLHFLTRPRVKITVPTGTFLDALRVLHYRRDARQLRRPDRHRRHHPVQEL